MAGFRRPFRSVPLRRRPENVLQFRRHPRLSRRASKARGWFAGLPFLPVMIGLPLGAFFAVLFFDGGPPGLAAVFPHAPAATEQDPEAARFGKCWGRRGTNCVIDGDSLMYRGRQIRIADIDAPELGHPRCEGERVLGRQAEDRLQDLLNAGPFSLEPIDRSTDRYGRELFVLTREGQSLGGMLVSEGLAHEWVGHKLSWCDGE